MAAAGTAGGLDLVWHLNLVGPRDFLLQLEEELETFVLEYQKNHCPPSELIFPPLARQYEALLIAASRRYGLHAGPKDKTGSTANDRWQQRSGQRRLAVRPAEDSKSSPVLPRASLAEFVRLQRLSSAEAPAPSAIEGCEDAEEHGDCQLHRRLRLRLWAIKLSCSALEAALADHQEQQAHPSAPNVKEELQEDMQGRVANASEEEQLPELGAVNAKEELDEDLRQEIRAVLSRIAAAAVKCSGRKASESQDDIEAAVKGAALTKHCYARFGPCAAKLRLFLRDDYARAPWPTAKLLRKPDAGSVVWRPEWWLPHCGCPGTWEEQASSGGVISWAVEPSSLAFGEGFEVSFRDEPGPSPACSSAASGQDDEDRSPGDFVLTFRRGAGAWHFNAGSRGRSSGGAEKTVLDSAMKGRAGQRHMFWAACLKCGLDGKHYILVGTIPGLLLEHFFVAKVGRHDPLTHVGFSYLPTPREAAFGQPGRGGDEGYDCPGAQPLVIESITVFPHGLSGELPFVSRRLLEVAPKENKVKNQEQERVLAALRLSEQQAPSFDCNAGGQHELDLKCKGTSLPDEDVKAEENGEEACRQSTDSSGKKRRRTMPVVDLSLSDSAFTSWAPAPGSGAALGPFSDSCKHETS
eukprot:TRINITY_DN41736_c0_g1_i1.p1 TRINITY_DN41736_c0_g1~~TRINITY_DN41736_c0_g1_i1.p1  ORF type:complete len:661 (+),score=173.71 TRINITY_DN41736_c0_g1_i1:75-1985(+)